MTKGSANASKLMLLVFVVLLFANCTVTQMTVSPHAYGAAIEKVGLDLAELGSGYQLTESNMIVKEGVKITGHPYNSRTGDYGTIVDNVKSTIDSYSYADTLGNTVNFEIQHNNKYDLDKKEFIDSVEVINCNCTDRKNGLKICSQDGIIKRNLRVVADQRSKIFSPQKSATLLSSSVLFLPCIVLLLVL
jgi:hypothetical protein